MLFFNIRFFKYFNLLINQTPAKAAVVDFYIISGFWELAAMIRKNLPAYMELQDFSINKIVVVRYTAC